MIGQVVKVFYAKVDTEEGIGHRRVEQDAIGCERSGGGSVWVILIDWRL